jgi:ABC-type glycerol-3-phosphate transport system substrate-binding protein
MSEKKIIPEKKISRRQYLAATGAIAAAAAIGGAAYYMSTPGPTQTSTATTASTATTGAEKPATTLKFENVWWMPDEKIHVSAMLKKFNEEVGPSWDPPLSVDDTFTPFEDYPAHILELVFAGHTPDCAAIDGMTMANALIPGGALAPLDDLMAPGDLDSISDYQWTSCKYNGKIYMIPYMIASDVIYYRKSALEKLGIAAEDLKTWDDLINAATTLMHKYGWEYGFLTRAKKSIAYKNFRWVLPSNGLGILEKDENGKWRSTFYRPEAIEGLKFYANDLIYKYKVTPPEVVGWGFAELEAAFGLGRAPMAVIEGFIDPWIIKDYPDIKDDFDIMPLPGGPGGKQVSTGATYATGVFEQSKNKEAAYKFLMQYVNAMPFMGPICQNWEAGVPSKKNILAMDFFNGGNYFATKKGKILAQYYVPEGSQMVSQLGEIEDAVIGPQIIKVMMGQTTAEKAADSINSLTNSILGYS